MAVLTETTESPGERDGHDVDRRTFLTFLVAAPALTVAAKLGVDAATNEASAQVPGLPDVFDLGDALILAGAPTAYDLVLEVTPENRVVFHLPRRPGHCHHRCGDRRRRAGRQAGRHRCAAVRRQTSRSAASANLGRS